MTFFVNENSRVYDALASGWDDQVANSPFYTNERRVALDLLDEYIPKGRRDRHILDFGCGTGEYTLHLLQRGYSVTGLDISPEMLRITGEKSQRHAEHLSLVLAGRSGLNVVKGPFDYVVSFGSVVNHVEDWPGLFRDLEGLVKPGGLLIFDVDNVFGLDYLLLSLYANLFRWDFRPSFREIGESIKSILDSTQTKNRWPLISNEGRRFDVHLAYWPLKCLLGMLRTSAWEVQSIRGANMLSCLVPAIVRSEIYSTAEPPRRLRGMLYEWAARLDNRLCRKLYQPAGIHLLVLKHRPT